MIRCSRTGLVLGNCHFATGPIIEFGETGDSAMTLVYDYHDVLDLSVSVYQGDAKRINSNGRTDWSFAIESWPSDYLSFGISYLSDLADSDERLLADNGNRYKRKVSALSGYLLWVEDNFEVSLEALGALRAFREMDADRNQPQAWNMEFVYFLTPKLDGTIRLEGSREFEDAPELQTGIAVNYRVHKNIALTIEALRGYFRDAMATDDDDNAYKTVNTLGAQVSIAF